LLLIPPSCLHATLSSTRTCFATLAQPQNYRPKPFDHASPWGIPRTGWYDRRASGVSARRGRVARPRDSYTARAFDPTGGL